MLHDIVSFLAVDRAPIKGNVEPSKGRNNLDVIT